MPYALLIQYQTTILAVVAVTIIICSIIGYLAEDLGFPHLLAALTGTATTGHAQLTDDLLSCPHHHHLHHDPTDHHLDFANHIRDTQTAPRTCPCCGWVGPKFDFYGSGAGRDDARCPYCGALERHRNACAFLGSHPDVLDVAKEEAAPAEETGENSDELTPQPQQQHSNALRLLHFAPHLKTAHALDAAGYQLDQIWIDSDEGVYNGNLSGKRPSTKTVHGALDNLEFPDNFAHGLIAIGILQKYEDVNLVMDELQRVLKPNGWMLLEVPMMSFTLNKSVECKTLKTKEEREKCGGSKAHHWHFAKKDFESLLATKFDCHDTSDLIKDSAGLQAYHAIQLKTAGRVVPQYFCRNNDKIQKQKEKQKES